jgi:hypothetical protein
MSDWAPGDLALCVDASGYAAGLLAEGHTYTVRRFLPAAPYSLEAPTDSVELLGVRRGRYVHSGFGCFRFRKIRPDKHEECEPEFVTLLKRSKVTA